MTFIVESPSRKSRHYPVTLPCVGAAEERSGRAEGPRSLFNAGEPGDRIRGRQGGGCRAAGAAEPGAPRGGGAGRPRWVSAHRPGELEAETVQDFSAVRCSQHGDLVGTMTQGYEADSHCDTLSCC